MFDEFRGRDPLSAMVLEGLGLELFARAARELGACGGRPPAWFARALELIQDRCSEPLTIREIAHEVGVHPYHLARVSRRFIGKTPGEMLRDFRMQKAAHLLARTRIAIGTVALTCGYADQSQFTRSFKKALGMSPGSFRRASS
jgi:AraC family transcriptional regulator